MKRIVKEEQPFERLEISKEDLLRLFGVRHYFDLYFFSSFVFFDRYNYLIDIYHFFSTIHLKFVFSMRK
jgi:threonyl-tRNA synthetase